MAIDFACPHCGHRTQVDEQFSGRQGPCVACGQTITIPSPARVPPAAGSGKSWVPIVMAVSAVVLVCPCIIGLLAGLLLPAVQNARESGRRAVCLNNLRQISMAMTDYETAHGKFPPAYVPAADGTPLHSWRALILPHLGRQDLYQQIDFNEAWDGARNSRWHDAMPEVFACPSNPPGSPFTSYVVVSGPGCIFNGSQQVSLADVGRGDGASQTLLVVETTDPVRWMEPRDIRFRNLGTMKIALRDIASHHPTGRNVVFADGTVKFLRNDLSESTMSALLTYQAGESIQQGSY